MARHRRLTERESKGGSNYNLDETIPTEAKQKKLAGSERTQTASEVLRKRVFCEVGELLNTTAPRSATDLRSAAKSIDLTDAALVANGIDPDSMALEPLLGFVENLTARREDRAAFIEALQDRADIPLELKVSVFVRVACNISMPHLARRDSLTAAVNLLANSTASSRLTTAFQEVLGNLVRNKSDRRMGAAVLGFVARQKFPIETACWLVEQVDPMLMRAHGIESPEVQQLKYAYDDARAFLEQSPKTSAATR